MSVHVLWLTMDAGAMIHELVAPTLADWQALVGGELEQLTAVGVAAAATDGGGNGMGCYVNGNAIYLGYEANAVARAVLPELGFPQWSHLLGPVVLLRFATDATTGEMTEASLTDDDVARIRRVLARLHNVKHADT